MAVPGTPFRVYFFHNDQVNWFDQDPVGRRTFHLSTLDRLWPDLPLVPTSGVPRPWVYVAYPVAPSVLCLNGYHVDVRRGTSVPWVYEPPLHLADGSRPSYDGPHQTISWDEGPILRVGTDLRDVRTGLVSRTAEFTLPWGTDTPGLPVVAIPGEPLRQFFTDGPGCLVRIGGLSDPVPLRTAFPELVVTDVDAVTVMYGDFQRPALADTTAQLADTDIQALVGVVQQTGVVLGRRGLLAVLHLLTRMSPGSYHPDGHFGMAHMTAEQLIAGGWTDSPAAILRAGAGPQVAVLGGYLASLAPAEVATPGQILAALATGSPVAVSAPATVIAAAPVPPRLQSLLPAGSDTIRLGDLHQLVAAVLTGPLDQELTARLDGSFVEPRGSAA